MKHFASLTRMRINLTLRNKMFIFFSLVMPFGFFFLYAGIFAKGDPQTVKLFLGPILAITVMGSFWGLSAALVTFREQGILRRFHVTPVTASDMLASSIVANYVLTLPTIAFELFFARFVFHVDSLGNLFSLWALITVGAISFAALGLVVASVTNTMQETQVLNQLIWLPLIFLSGATLPLPLLPNMAQKVAAFLPATYLVRGLQAATYSAQSVDKLLMPIFALATWAVLTFFLASQLFRWEPEVKMPRNAKLWALATILPFFLLGVWEDKYGSMQVDARSAWESVDHPSRRMQNFNPAPAAPSSKDTNPGAPPDLPH